jgi:hypothetical protein
MLLISEFEQEDDNLSVASIKSNNKEKKDKEKTE